MFNPQPKPIKEEGKRCKGTYRADHFDGCGALTDVRKYGLCRTCIPKWLATDSENATKYIKSLSIRAKKDIAKINREKKKALKESMTTITEWKQRLQNVINWIVREIDKDQPCISHPEMKSFLRYDAGHYYSVASFSDLRFNLHNIHKQSSQANEMHGGGAAYVDGLIDRYGDEYMTYVRSLRLKHKGIAKDKFTIDNIRSIYLPNASKVKREMQKGAEFTRNQVNEFIGIY